MSCSYLLKGNESLEYKEKDKMKDEQDAARSVCPKTDDQIDKVGVREPDDFDSPSLQNVSLDYDSPVLEELPTEIMSLEEEQKAPSEGMIPSSIGLEITIISETGLDYSARAINVEHPKWVLKQMYSEWVVKNIQQISVELGISLQGLEQHAFFLFSKLEKRLNEGRLNDEILNIAKKKKEAGLRELRRLYSSINYNGRCKKKLDLGDKQNVANNR